MDTAAPLAIHVAKPCPVRWDSMAGDSRVRFCGACRLNVYNVSEMTRDEAGALVREREGRRCIRLLRRPDGTVVTKDCPAGVRQERVRRASRVTAAAALLASFAGALVGCRPPGFTEVSGYEAVEITPDSLVVPVEPAPMPAPMPVPTPADTAARVSPRRL